MTIVEDLESAIDIVDLVNKYTKLQKSGANYKSVCPFPGHSEKTPSFIVSPSKQLAYCFGCHKGGGPLKFVMDIENCSFAEGVNILSNLTGIKTNFAEDKSKDFLSVYSILKDITNYYKKRLAQYPSVEKYLFDRGITSEDIQKFSLGFSDSGIELYNYLKEKGYDDKLIDESGVFMDLKGKKEKFLNRIIFPIKNQRGDTVAFAGRVTNNSLPKYINSSASNIYDKSAILFGLFEARNEIVKKDFIIITEGYMDTITLHRNDITNSVCVSGTALTEKHIGIIKKLTKRIYLCFDSDEAGEKATISSIELLKNKELEVKIIKIIDAKDPDEFLSKGLNFEDLIKNALTPIGFYFSILEKNYDLTSLNEKKNLLSQLLKILKNYSDNIEIDFYLKEISKKLDINLELVYLEFKRLRGERKDEGKKIQNKGVGTEDLILAYIFEKPELLDIFREKLLFIEKMALDTQKILNEGVSKFSSLDIEKQNLIKGLTIEVSKKLLDSNFLKEIEKIISKTNSDLFKETKQDFLEKMKLEPENLEILTEYSKFLEKSFKNGLK